MEKIQMVDLQGQYLRIKEEIDEAILKVLGEANFIQGPAVKTFEENLERFTGASHCISCANGTDALQIAMMALQLKPGDEIIIPAFTYVATVEAAALLGLTIKLAEVDSKTFNIAPEAIQKLISPRTKAIVPVHLFGQCADMQSILNIAKENNLFVIEDCAQSIGSKYRFDDGNELYSGTMGNIGVTSFFPSKNLGCFGDGGALFAMDKNLANEIRMIANHGQKRKYYHDCIGINSRLDTIQATVLNVKLKYLQEYLNSRQKAARFYDLAFSNNSFFETPFRDSASTHVFHQYTIIVQDNQRDSLKEFLAAKGIPSMIYYPQPVHLQKAYEYLGYKKGDFPISEYLSEKILSLPMHTELTDLQLEYITESVFNFFKSNQ